MGGEVTEQLACGHPRMACSHCGRTGMVYVLWEYPAIQRLFYRVCTSDQEGVPAQPHCHALVDSGAETIGQRKWSIET